MKSAPVEGKYHSPAVVHPEEYTPSENVRKAVDAELTQYPTRMAATLPVLHILQREHGWLSKAAMQYAAEATGTSLNHIYGVVSFYDMFRDRPVGRHLVRICTNVSCMLCGAYELADHLKKKLGVNSLNETTADKRIYLEEVECLGACSFAPAVQIDDNYHVNMTPDKVDALLEKLP